MPIPLKKDSKGNVKPIFAGTEEAQGSDVKMVLCGWCEREVPADAEVCPFCKRDPRQPGAMADLMARADVINEARDTRDEGDRKKPGFDPLAAISSLVSPPPKKK